MGFGVRLGPTKNAMMQQWHAGQYKVQGDTRLILIRHRIKAIRALWTIRLILIRHCIGMMGFCYWDSLCVGSRTILDCASRYRLKADPTSTKETGGAMGRLLFLLLLTLVRCTIALQRYSADILVSYWQ